MPENQQTRTKRMFMTLMGVFAFSIFNALLDFVEIFYPPFKNIKHLIKLIVLAVYIFFIGRLLKGMYDEKNLELYTAAELEELRRRFRRN